MGPLVGLGPRGEPEEDVVEAVEEGGVDAVRADVDDAVAAEALADGGGRGGDAGGVFRGEIVEVDGGDGEGWAHQRGAMMPTASRA